MGKAVVGWGEVRHGYLDFGLSRTLHDKRREGGEDDGREGFEVIHMARGAGHGKLNVRVITSKLNLWGRHVCP